MGHNLATALAGIAILASGLSACSTVSTERVPSYDTADLVLVRGFRAEGDPCKVTGETAYTNQFLDDSATLVSCPATYSGLAAFVQETGARRVGQRGDFLLYSVPRR
ncbi:hypothetical protein PSA7680_01293 [Pseudoruegeria aquimaris]|uniref:Lipoprotein n=1 Tax=Pseudoruegeria aquimaris TaxID=393663 RepID=A0A1Y5RYG3_9RHOB|nr:hypothetical protein [Pseudoruegeria aquimaris]SLN28554.1 hypothetical protein PSA7680_01293 [Pseudoruegeria aquimaris]